MLLASIVITGFSAVDAGRVDGSGRATREGAAPNATANPTVVSASGGQGQASGGMRYDVTQFGYEEREFFFDGTAKAFSPVAVPRCADARR
jgi:hypothetical protein